MTEWTGLLNGRRSDDHDTALKAPLERSKAGGSGAFRALADDGFEYFVKPLNNNHGPRILIAERVAGIIGNLIDAPTCQVSRILIGEDHRGWQYTEGVPPAAKLLEPGVAHASRAISGCFEVRPPLQYRNEDDNQFRQVGIYALYDWCWGGDSQWLVSQAEEHRYYSHDHGWYIPPEGADWSIAELTAQADTPRELAESTSGLKRDDMDKIATKLESVTREQLVEVLAGIPISWPATDADLECIGFFLERRAPAVAARLRARMPAP